MFSDLADDSSGDIKRDAGGNAVVDYENIQRSRLRVDSRKWLLSKLLPKRFGDKPNELHVNASVNSVLVTTAMAEKIQARRREALESASSDKQ